MSSPASKAVRPIKSLVPARLDRLPWVRFHWLIVVAVAELLELDLAELRRATVAEVRELLVDGVLLVGFGG